MFISFLSEDARMQEECRPSLFFLVDADGNVLNACPILLNGNNSIVYHDISMTMDEGVILVQPLFISA